MAIDYVPSTLTQEDFDQAPSNFNATLDLPVPYEALQAYVAKLSTQTDFESKEDFVKWLTDLQAEYPDTDVFTQGIQPLGLNPQYIGVDGDLHGFYLLDENLDEQLYTLKPHVMLTWVDGVMTAHVGYLYHYYDHEVHDEEIKRTHQRTYRFLTLQGDVDVDVEKSSFHYSPRFAELAHHLERFVIRRAITNLSLTKPAIKGVLANLGDSVEVYDIYRVPHQYYTPVGQTQRSLLPFQAGRLFKGSKGTLYRPFTLDVPALQLTPAEAATVPLTGDFIVSKLTDKHHQVSTVRLVRHDGTLYVCVRSTEGTYLTTNDLPVLTTPYERLDGFWTNRDCQPGDLSKYDSGTLTFFGLDDRIYKAMTYGDYEEYVLPGVNTRLSATDALTAVQRGDATLAFLDADYKTWRAVRLTDRNNLHREVLGLLTPEA